MYDQILFGHLFPKNLEEDKCSTASKRNEHCIKTEVYIKRYFSLIQQHWIFQWFFFYLLDFLVNSLCYISQKGFPETEIIRCHTKDVVEAHFMSSLKEVSILRCYLFVKMLTYFSSVLSLLQTGNLPFSLKKIEFNKVQLKA